MSADYDVLGHFREPYEHIQNKTELFTKISKGVRPILEDDLPKETVDMLKKCWHTNVVLRPTIDNMLTFFRNAEVSHPDLKNAAKGKRASFKNLKGPSTLSPEKQTILLVDGDREISNSLLLENDGQNWKQINIKLPYVVGSYGAQFLNNNLFIFGGYDKNLKELTWTYKLSTNLQWEKMADMNQKRRGISNGSVILNNQIWVCGGYYFPYHTLSSVEMYDPLTNKWKYMKSMNNHRKDPAAAVVNGKIFCSSGFKTTSVEYYDPSSDVWTLICNMPARIGIHGAIEIDGNFTVIHENNVWAMDTTAKKAKWIEKSSMSIPRSFFTIAKIDSKVYVCGGKVEDNEEWKPSNLVDIFDGKVWNNGPKMPIPRTYGIAVTIPMEFARKLEQFSVNRRKRPLQMPSSYDHQYK